MAVQRTGCGEEWSSFCGVIPLGTGLSVQLTASNAWYRGKRVRLMSTKIIRTSGGDDFQATANPTVSSCKTSAGDAR